MGALTRPLTHGKDPDHHEVQAQPNGPYRREHDRDEVSQITQRRGRLHRGCGRIDRRFDARIEMLLQEAEDSGEATEMTAEDWADIRREGMALLKSRRSA